MLNVLSIEECEGYLKIRKIQEFDAESLLLAKETFREYRDRMVLDARSFASDNWKATNQIKNYTFRFDIDRDAYNKGGRTWIRCSRKVYVDSMKIFVLLKLGSVELSSIQAYITALRKLAVMSEDEASDAVNSRFLIEFLMLLPGQDMKRDQMIELFEENLMARSWKQRQSRKLADFKEYLAFHEEMKTFWRDAGEEDRYFYFPVYFWWNLTSILPLRPTEYLMTPEDCLSVNEEGKDILSVRRTVLKKKRGKVSYNLDDDYQIQEYEIPHSLAEAVREYSAVEHSGIVYPYEHRTLLKPGSLSESWYMTYPQLARRLEMFKVKILGRSDCQIHLGDTRHLAMINLILSGGSPVICRELAGHEDIDISSHYYANLSTVVESVTYHWCSTHGNEISLEGNLFFPVSRPEQMLTVKDGSCSYLPVAGGDISECLKNCDLYRPGSCYGCIHFYPDTPGLRMKIEHIRKTEVDHSGDLLFQMIELVREGKGSTEDIRTALARIRNCSRKYSEALGWKYRREES